MVHSLELMVHSLELNSKCVQIGFIISNLEIWNIAHLPVVFYNSCLEAFSIACLLSKYFLLNLRIAV